MTDNRATLEIIAPTIDEAIEKGLADLGLTREEVDVEIMDEGSGGLFGLGSRQSRVMLIVKGITESGGEPDSTPEEDTTSEAKPWHASLDDTAEVKDDANVVDVAQSVVSDLLYKMRIDDAKVDAYLGDPYGPQQRIPVHVNIYGDDLSILIGHRGETLESLQYIARLMLGKELERSVPLIIDVEGYRSRREQQIRTLTRRVADQVMQNGRSQPLEPMPANERRIAHMELQEDSDVYTESAGVGRQRKVVIYPQD
ncbi:MAG: Jag N-terminal domain-containing protein [Anaerolineales bacterium]|nr:Jag N-terminal domain-containing protein [Chloroflexota bacterium]MBL6980992.1 Jag N-terminal domain-containing protein [Anaerolineales bacterium]